MERWTCRSPEELCAARVALGERAAVVSGMLDEHRFHFDRAAVVPEEAWRASQVSVVLIRCDGLPASVPDLPVAMRSEPWPVRAATLRQVALHQPQSAPGVHHDALLDPHYGVRMFAAYQLSGVLPLPFRPDVSALLKLVADPLEARAFEPWPDWDLHHGRRNVRLALLWALGNLGWATRSATAGWQRDAWTMLQAGLCPPEEDLAYDDLLAQLRGDPRRGVAGERCSLQHLLRYALLRWRLMQRLGVDDRFFWFEVAVRGVCPDALPDWLVATAPELPVDSLPDGWRGRNPYGVS